MLRTGFIRCLGLLFLSSKILIAQSSPIATLDRIHQAALTSDYGYKILDHLANVIGPRMTGSPQAAAAVDYVAAQFRALGLQVNLEATPVPHWVRGEESAELVEFNGRIPGTTQKIVITALGGSPPTPSSGISAPVVVVNDIGDLESHSREVTGKIVLFNGHFDQRLADAGFAHDAYLQVVRSRVMGADKAVRLGAVGALLRSIGPGGHRLAHTGSVIFRGGTKIPAAAVSAEDADLIARLSQQGPVQLHLLLTPQVLPEARSFNVIADFPGTTHPEQIVIVSAHLDSWDLGTGALDNGTGVAVILQVAQVLHDLGIKPARTIRFIAWMNEEQGGSGYLTYIKEHEAELSRHVANVEIDNGSGHPLGYTAYADEKLLQALNPLKAILAGTGSALVRKAPEFLGDLDEFMPGFGLVVDDRDFYDYHHTAADTYDKVNPQALKEQVSVIAVLSEALADLGDDAIHRTQ
jgi:carboxypeptidase Q